MADIVTPPGVIAAAAKPGPIRNAGKVAARHAHRYAPAYLRGLMYILSAAIINFIETFEKLTPAAAAQLTALGWACLALKPINAAVIAGIAFLDQTLARINTKVDQEEERESRAPFVGPGVTKISP